MVTARSIPPSPKLKAKIIPAASSIPPKNHTTSNGTGSTFRPLDVHGTQIVDKYWETAAVETETIKATCDFEFVNDY